MSNFGKQVDAGFKATNVIRSADTASPRDDCSRPSKPLHPNERFRVEAPSEQVRSSQDVLHPHGARQRGANTQAITTLTLREIMEHHEALIRSILNAKQSTADEVVRQARNERDIAIAEIKALKRDTKQMIYAARGEGEAAGRAQAVQDILAAAGQNYVVPKTTPSSAHVSPLTKTVMPAAGREQTEGSSNTSSGPPERHQVSLGPVPASGHLSKILAKLPPPKKIKSTKQMLPKSFVDKVMCKNEHTFTTKVTENKRLDVVDWQTIVRIDPEIHESAPDYHRHGALTFVQGDPYSGGMERERADRAGGEKADSFPVFRYWKDKRTFADGYHYIGHYTVSSLEVIPKVTWENWDLGRKRTVAANLLQSEWGRNMLSYRFPSTLRLPLLSNGEEAAVDDVLAFFYREEEPNLQMQHTVLRQIQFSSTQCKKVAQEFGFDENGREKSVLKRSIGKFDDEDWGSAGKKSRHQNSEDEEELYDASPGAQT